LLRSALLYGALLALFALLLAWMDFRHLARAWFTPVVLFVPLVSALLPRNSRFIAAR